MDNRNWYQPKTGVRCHCKRGDERANCPDCEGTGMRIDFAAIRARTKATLETGKVDFVASNKNE